MAKRRHRAKSKKDPVVGIKSLSLQKNGVQSLSYSPDGIQEFKIRTEVRTEVLGIRQESWLFYRQIFQDFAAIATKFLRFITLNS